MVAPDSDGVIGLDLGGSKIALRLERDDGSSSEDRLALSGEAEADLVALGHRLAALTRGRRPRAVGLAHAPTLDAAGRVSRWPNRPRWEGLALLDRLTAMTAAPVVAADDGCAAALADARRLGESTLLHLALGTGVGGGLVLGGRLYLPPGGVGTEFGHMIIVPGGRPCTCGRRGCLQAHASALAVRHAAAAAGGPPPDDLASVVTRAADGDAAARDALDHAAFALAVALTTLSEILGPMRITLGGGMTAAVPGLADRIADHAQTLVRPGATAPVPQPSPHGARAAVIGACLLARDALRD